MYEKVSTNLNFVEREEKTLDFWKRTGFLRNLSRRRRESLSIHFMTDLRQLTASLI